VSEPYLVNGIPMQLSTSIGIGIYPDDAGEVAALIASADGALYEAKRSGKNRSCTAQMMNAKAAQPQSMSVASA
jgi:GGDEF domain-containing protein